MAKKLITVLLTLTIIACSSISIYATTEDTAQNNDVTNVTNVTNTEQNTVNTEDTQTKARAVSKSEKKAEKYKKGLAAYIRSVNPNVSKSKSLTMAGHFISKGKKYNVDAKVLMAIAQNESTFYTSAKSPYGYKGLMQTSDALARQYGYKPSSLFKAEVSIDVGARYLGAMKKEFKTYTKALSAYAYGFGTVKSGNYSTAIANKLLKTRTNITRYLERNNYI